jgi:hypothetical protein
MVLTTSSRRHRAREQDRSGLERFCTHFNFEPMVAPTTLPTGGGEGSVSRRRRRNRYGGRNCPGGCLRPAMGRSHRDDCEEYG